MLSKTKKEDTDDDIAKYDGKFKFTSSSPSVASEAKEIKLNDIFL